MRMAFLPVVLILAGGAAWGQTAVPGQTGQKAPPVFAAPPMRGLAVLPGPTTRIPQVQIELAPGQFSPSAMPGGSDRVKPEPIPTQWPHAKPEAIPTQWKAHVILVGRGDAPAAKKPAGTAAGSVVTPK